MDNFHDNILFQTRQHKIILFWNFFKGVIIVGIPFILIIYFSLNYNDFIKICISIIFILLIFLYYLFFWWKSYFIISNKKISKKVRNGLFSKYHMSIYFENVKDIAYSKNNILHYLLNYGTFFARSSPGASGDFIVKHIPNIDKIYKIVNYLHTLPKEKREEIKSLDKINEGEKKESVEEVIELEKNNLLAIKGIKEVILLNDGDRKYIFEHEEDRNHGIHETIRKKIVFCITHDLNFRNADASIVLKLGKKVIFPAVSFHEINRPSVVSSSPGLEIHNYLSPKFEKVDEYDATVLVGFDL